MIICNEIWSLQESEACHVLSHVICELDLCQWGSYWPLLLNVFFGGHVTFASFVKSKLYVFFLNSFSILLLNFTWKSCMRELRKLLSSETCSRDFFFLKCKNMTLFHLCTLDISGGNDYRYFPVFSKDITSLMKCYILFLLHSIVVSVSWSILWVIRSNAKK